MKRTAYKVEGTTFQRPDGLPEGLEATEVEVDDPRAVEVSGYQGVQRLRLYVADSAECGHDIRFAVGPSRGQEEGVYLTRDSARQIRDCLNAILGEDKPKRRVFKQYEDDDWLWWEVTPGLFTSAATWTEAQQDVQKGETYRTSWTLGHVQDADSNLIDVTHEHPEVNE